MRRTRDFMARFQGGLIALVGLVLVIGIAVLIA